MPSRNASSPKSRSRRSSRCPAQRRLHDDGLRDRRSWRRVFQKSPAEAYRIMMQVHVNGRGIAGVYPWEVAETKVDTVTSMARDAGYPLRRRSRKSKTTVFSASVEIVLAHRLSRSRLAPARVPDARASAVRAGPRSRRRAHPRRLRRRPARLRRELDAYLDESIEQLARGQERRAGADGGVPPRPADRRAARAERAAARKCRPATFCAAILQQPKTHAARLLAEQGITRLDVLEYISHGIAKTPSRDAEDGTQPGAPAGDWTKKGRPRRGIRWRRTASTSPTRAARACSIR